MNADLELGRIAGIRIGVNWSWLIVFALIVWTLASAVFPSQNPALSKGTYIAMAVVAAVVFFASLLLHELGHAIQARREGVEIEGITLWLFGGVAQFKGMLRATRPNSSRAFRPTRTSRSTIMATGMICAADRTSRPRARSATHSS